MVLRKRLRADRAPQVPVELVEEDEPLWRDLEASRAWFQVNGLNPGLAFNSGPASRRKAAIIGWAIENGFASEKWPQFPDWHRVSELGIQGC